MGVFIYPCKIKEKVSDITKSDNEMDALYDKYNALHEEIVTLENTSKYYDLISPFEEGVYTYDSGKADIDITYGCYSDFLRRLEDLCDEGYVDIHNPFSTTISASGIDNCVSYKIAEEMLEEFTQFQEQAKKCFMENDGNDYGMTLWGVYKDYMAILRECIEMKGIVRYH